MSVTGEIKNLYSDKDKTRVLLPRTKTKAVSDENGVGLDVLLDEINVSIKKAASVNLLDNTDFRNPVNQRGYVSGTAGSANYTIDRWKLQYNTYLHLHSGYVGISGFWTFTQLVGCKMFAGKTYTFSVEARSEADNGNMFMRFGDPTGTGAKEHRQAVNSNGWTKCVKTWTADRDYEPGECDFSFGINTGNELTTQIYYKNPAVYEGEYTAETLPEYQPKGYGAELAECQRYLRKFRWLGGETMYAPIRVQFPLPMPMRMENPTVNYTVLSGDGTVTVSMIENHAVDIAVAAGFAVLEITVNADL